MNRIPETQRMARFALGACFETIPASTVAQLKLHLLDSMASLVHSLDKPTPQKLLLQITSLGEDGRCAVPIVGHVAVDRAAQLYTGLIRYVDFTDHFIAKNAACYPSDNIGALLAAGQVTHASGKEFLTAMAVAYEMQCRLCQQLPVMMKGFDTNMLLGYAVTASLSRMFGLSEMETSHAIAMAGCTFNPFVTSLAGYTREWKGFASSMVNLGCTNVVLQAKQGMTGPLSLFEGPMGLEEIFGMSCAFNWQEENYNLIPRCVLKSYNTEVHTQSAIETVLELQQLHDFAIDDIEEIEITTFMMAYHLVGGGKYGDRSKVFDKEQASHSLPYVVAVALLDGQLYPEQLSHERINRKDVQSLLKKVKVATAFPVRTPRKIAARLDPFTKLYPGLLPARVDLQLKDGRTLSLKKDDYNGFHSRPLQWNDVEKKFKRLTENIIDDEVRTHITEVIADLENWRIGDLMEIVAAITIPESRPVLS
ncbi:2-methylcitrate dehydratase [Chitinophaga costaii]|uniref:2-methylcitrate dehydratase n=1 Tax=Chitinophaga costaii TaxID=1335309 RepID=A0A1C4C1P9_9BACT|nr:MmgE/PrpD family protein [Chitinophaga costaii]PUZ27374.1 MmgE/PrpD family protein [Chitinophaga costaii]SCC13000.1 2-methylcitrate dehydratase [Chitinophaga costaii]